MPSAEYEAWNRYLPISFSSNLTPPKNASPRLGQVLLDRVRQVLHGHRLQPHAARTRERCEEDAVAAGERIFDTGDGGDVELHGFMVHADMTGMDAKSVAVLQFEGQDLAVRIHPV